MTLDVYRGRKTTIQQQQQLVHWKKSQSCRFWIVFGYFFKFILKMVYCVYLLESPRRGDSNENTQYTFMLKKIEKYPYYAS